MAIYTLIDSGLAVSVVAVREAIYIYTHPVLEYNWRGGGGRGGRGEGRGGRGWMKWLNDDFHFFLPNTIL